MDVQSNSQNPVQNTSGYKLSLLDVFAEIKKLFLKRATKEERRNVLDDFELLHPGFRKDEDKKI